MPARPDARAWGRRNIQPSAPVNAGYYNIQPDQPFTGPADRLDDRSANGLLSGDGGCDGEEERKIIRLVCPREGDACARKQADAREIPNLTHLDNDIVSDLHGFRRDP
jgi:hypothetical protein